MGANGSAAAGASALQPWVHHGQGIAVDVAIVEPPRTPCDIAPTAVHVNFKLNAIPQVVSCTLWRTILVRMPAWASESRMHAQACGIRGATAVCTRDCRRTTRVGGARGEPFHRDAGAL